METNSMKTKISILIITNIVLLIGVIILFILFFSSRQGQTAKQANQAKDSSAMSTSSFSDSSLAIAYINTDSVLSQYKMVQSLEGQLKGEGENMKAELQRRQRQLQQEFQDYQKRVQNNTISVDEAKQIEQELMEKEQQLYQLQQNYTEQYTNKTMGMNQVLVDTVRSFLSRYTRNNPFDYVLARSVAKNNILFAKESYDITKDVIEKMNQEYDQQENNK